MKILFLSRFGEGADLAMRLVREGHRVRFWIEGASIGSHPKENGFKENADGLVDKVVDWRPSVSWADLAVFDYNSEGLARIWEQIHRKVPCFGGSRLSQRLEDDREFARGLFKKCGFTSLESHSFKTLKEAAAHLKEHKVAHVIKPSGPRVEKQHLIVGHDKDNSDSLLQIETMIDSGLQVESVEVQETRRGVEVALSRFCNGRAWVGPAFLNFEHKRSHERETGFLTGETGELARYVADPEDPFVSETLDKFLPVLRAYDYRGVIDLNMIVGRDPDTGERFCVVLESTPRFGYPPISLMQELWVSPAGELLSACANGDDYNLQVRYEWCVGVLLCAFGFPFEEQVEKNSRGLVVQNMDSEKLDHLHPMNLRLNKRGQYTVSYSCGYVLVATGRGESIEDAKERAYDVLGEVCLPNSYHRFDISDKIDPMELDDLGILPISEGER